jgi:hypothetical protein
VSFAAVGVGQAQPESAPNTLTAQEKSDGWRLLFDGKSLDSWRGYKMNTLPAGWSAVDGTITLKEKPGDIITKEQFGDFELMIDWKIASGGNSGIIYRATEDGATVWETGPELQVLDNATHKDGADPKTSAGANYALNAPTRDATRPVGQWNQVRIVAKGGHVEHWLNGVKIVEYELWSPEWAALVKASKFSKYPKYGLAKRGHIALQDHGDPVWFRNIKIRNL